MDRQQVGVEMSYALHACQICDNRYPIVYHDEIENYYQCRCPECHAHTEKFEHETQAMRAWNTGQVEVEW